MDTPKKIKTKQMVTLVGGAAAFISLLIVGMWLSDPNRGQPDQLSQSRAKARELTKNYGVTSATNVTAEQSWIARSEKELTSVKAQNKQLQQSINKLQEKLEKMEKSTFDGNASHSSGQKLNGNLNSIPLPKSPGLVAPASYQTLLPTPASLSQGSEKKSEKEKFSESIGLIDMTDDADGGKVNNVSHFLPAGTIATVVLLTGMDARTGGGGESDPHPVNMRLVNDGKLPNFFESGIKDCHIIGAGWGDIASERAYIRLEKMSCVLETGRVIDTKLKGYVTGEDGKHGFRGRLVSKQGSLIAKSMLAGVFSGMGSIVAQQGQQIQTSALGTVKTMDPAKMGQAALAQGAATSANNVADFYLKRASEIFPIIEIASERIGEIVLQDGADLGINILDNM